MATKRLPARPGRSRRGPPGREERDDKGREVRGILVRVNPAGSKALRQLALDRDQSLQALAVEAFNDVLKKYGARPVVENPLDRPE